MGSFVALLKRRKFAWSAGALAALMLWSVLDGTAGGQVDEPEEPAELAAYSTFADAASIQTYFDHQARLIPLAPAIAHSNTEVVQPSQTNSIAWLVDGGLANGLHGTTTGSGVPTQAAAQQPSGASSQEFSVAGGPIGNDEAIRVQAGRAYALAQRSAQVLRGYANSFFGNLWVLPAAGSPRDPPGAFDPDARFPGGPDSTDPAPRGQMAILSIGSIASTSESFRDGDQLTSVGVAELTDINIGNRTSDNRCTNCIRIDKIRAEAYAQANGRPGGSRAAYRVIVGRACRRRSAFSVGGTPVIGEPGVEADLCAPLDPHHPNPLEIDATHGLQSIDELEQLNEFFAEPIWVTITNGQVDYQIGIRIHAGTQHQEPDRTRRTVSPRDDARRNYAYPDLRPKDPEAPQKGVVAPDSDQGQVAKAVAEGLDIDIFTITTSQIVDDASRRIAGTPAQAILDEVDQDHDSPGIQISPGPLSDRTGTVTIPTDTIRSVRRVNLTLGVARAAATARPLPAISVPSGGDGSSGAGGGVVVPPPSSGGSFGSFVPPVSGPQPPTAPGTTIIQSGLRGPLRVRIDWDSVRIKPWPPGDMAKAIFVGAIFAGMAWLIRRRLRIGRAPLMKT